MERVIAYIDGFNLYFGLRACGWKDVYWLNLRQLVLNLLKPHQRLVYAKYFTARVSRPDDKRIRQNTFLEALDTLPNFTTYFGHYLLASRRCPNCRRHYQEPTEKMTDVSIAVEMLADAVADQYDTALLISGDSDLCPPVEKVRFLFPAKRIVVAFPPNRHSAALAHTADVSFMIGRAKLKKSAFPDIVIRSDGFQLCRPKEWK